MQFIGNILYLSYSYSMKYFLNLQHFIFNVTYFVSIHCFDFFSHKCNFISRILDCITLFISTIASLSILRGEKAIRVGYKFKRVNDELIFLIRVLRYNLRIARIKSEF